MGGAGAAGKKRYCPPVALSLVMGASGSIKTAAKAKSCNPLNPRKSDCAGVDAMKVFSKRLLDAVHSGPKGKQKNEYNVVKFSGGATTIRSKTKNYQKVRESIDSGLTANGGTNIGSGIAQ